MEEFKLFWPQLVKRATENSKYGDIYQSLSWLQRVMEENVPFGKQTRASLFLTSYAELKPLQTENEKTVSYVVAWCLEIMQTAYLIADDIMDKSETRRGKPCWYRLPDVGPLALNDSLMLENLVYQLLTEFVKDKYILLELHQLFQETSFRTILGQSLDARLSLSKNFEKFTMENYEAIIKYKTSYYTFYNPVAAALVLAGIEKRDSYTKIEDIGIKLGRLFQVQDDFMDCFGDPNITGKIGTDILEGKCTWLAVKAIDAANSSQKALFDSSYGYDDYEKEKMIKNLYLDLNIPKMYRKFEMKAYRDIIKSIRELPEDIPRRPLIGILNKLYKRQK